MDCGHQGAVSKHLKAGDSVSGQGILIFPCVYLSCVCVFSPHVCWHCTIVVGHVGHDVRHDLREFITKLLLEINESMLVADKLQRTSTLTLQQHH